MAGKVALLYREFLKDYVVNDRGDLCYEPKKCQTFPEFESARSYILKQFGGKKVQLVMDDYCKTNHEADLEKRLLKAKITIVKD